MVGLRWLLLLLSLWLLLMLLGRQWVVDGDGHSGLVADYLERVDISAGRLLFPVLLVARFECHCAAGARFGARGWALL